MNLTHFLPFIFSVNSTFDAKFTIVINYYSCNVLTDVSQLLVGSSKILKTPARVLPQGRSGLAPEVYYTPRHPQYLSIHIHCSSLLPRTSVVAAQR